MNNNNKIMLNILLAMIQTITISTNLAKGQVTQRVGAMGYRRKMILRARQRRRKWKMETSLNPKDS